eukprot:499998_1
MAHNINLNSTDNITTLTQEEKEVQQWLKDVVRFPQYEQAFLKNGYGPMIIIGDISKREELEEIGITIKGHQVRIMRQIKQLQNVQDPGAGIKKKVQKDEDEEMIIIGDISKREELEEIGITIKGHQVRIMRQIKQLQNVQDPGAGIKKKVQKDEDEEM